MYLCTCLPAIQAAKGWAVRRWGVLLFVLGVRTSKFPSALTKPESQEGLIFVATSSQLKIGLSITRYPGNSNFNLSDKPKFIDDFKFTI